MKKIGLRNIKTAVAVVLSMIFLKLIGHENYFYAGIAAVISMQASVYDSFKTGRNRMIGTTVGAIIGIIFAFISPGNFILIAIGIILVIHFCNSMNFNKSATIACIVFIAIMVNLKGITPIVYGTNRLLETFVGIVIAVLVNYTILPNDSIKRINIHYDLVKKEVFDVFNYVIMSKKHEKYDSLKTHIIKVEGLLNSLEVDSKHIRKKEINLKIEKIRLNLNLLKEANIHIKALNYIDTPDLLSSENIKTLKEKFPTMIIDDKMISKDHEEHLNSEHFIVYNYHIKKLIRILEKLA